MAFIEICQQRAALQTEALPVQRGNLRKILLQQRDNPAVTFRQTAIVIRAEFMERRVRLEPELLIDITSGFRRIQAECTAVLQKLHEFFQHH